MKRLLVAVLFIVLSVSQAWAAQDEDDYRDLDQLRARLIRMQREMNSFMKELASPYMENGRGAGVFGQDVRVDITSNDKEVIVKADLPGMDKDKIDVVLEKNRILKISGSREMEMKQEAPGVVRQERMSGHFERTLELPSDCESNGIKATYKEGVLEIVLPKKVTAKEDMIKVNVQ
jgi:HSP20 family protein